MGGSIPLRFAKEIRERVLRLIGTSDVSKRTHPEGQCRR